MNIKYLVISDVHDDMECFATKEESIEYAGEMARNYPGVEYLIYELTIKGSAYLPDPLVLVKWDNETIDY